MTDTTDFSPHKARTPINPLTVRDKVRTLPAYGNLERNSSGSPLRKASASPGFLHHYDFELEEDEEDAEKNSDKMKMKLMSLWNNVKYGWSAKTKSNFSSEIPIWFLGVCYHKHLVEHKAREDKCARATAYDLFKHDYYSRIWLTYRREFRRLSGTQLTTDCGWGCMLRTGQMLLSQAFLSHYLGRKWRWCGPQSDKADMIHRMIIRWFVDDPNPKCSPFSVHQLVKLGTRIGKKPGDWFGPASVAYILREALNEAILDNELMDGLCAYVAQDCTVYIQDVLDLCSRPSAAKNKKSRSLKERPAKEGRQFRFNSLQTAYEVPTHGSLRELKSNADRRYSENNSAGGPALPLFGNKASSTFNLTEDFSVSNEARSLPYDVCPERVKQNGGGQKWRGVVIFIPVRLGGEKFNPIYTDCIKALFTHPACIGIIGGKPRHSLYFVGVQGDKLIYLEPHYCQEAIDIRQTNFPLHSFHSSSPLKMPINRIDPSCTIGFYCHTRQDFLDLADSVKDFSVTPHNHLVYPLFVFSEGSSSDSSCNSSFQERVFRIRHRNLNSGPNAKAEYEHDVEEFVMI